MRSQFVVLKLSSNLSYNPSQLPGLSLKSNTREEFGYSKALRSFVYMLAIADQTAESN